MSDAIDRCPKCGGSGGFEGVLVMRYYMAGDWGRPWETSGSDKVVYRSQSVKCSDCGGRVPVDVAEGYKPANALQPAPAPQPIPEDTQ